MQTMTFTSGNISRSFHLPEVADGCGFELGILGRRIYTITVHFFFAMATPDGSLRGEVSVRLTPRTAEHNSRLPVREALRRIMAADQTRP